MSNSNTKTVRGLSIAVLVLSILSLVAMVLLLVFFGAALSDPSVINSLSYELNDSLDYYLNVNIQEIMMLIFTMMGIFAVWPVVCSAVTIIAAILGIRNCDNITKLGSAFGWALAGIVFSLLCGRLITAVLLIISAVYINKLRKTPVVPYGQPCGQPSYAQPYYGRSPYGQPPYEQPQPQPFYPQQPYAPFQPTSTPPDSQEANQQQPPTQ